MTSLTVITLILIVYGVLFNRYDRVLAISGATATGAAVLVNVAVPTFYAVALGSFLLVLASLLNPQPSKEFLNCSNKLHAGVLLLIIFAAYSTLLTLLAPFFFPGLRVQSSTGDTARLVAGDLTTSNIAQIGYLLLGTCVVIYIARMRSPKPELIGLCVGLTLALSFWRYLHLNVSLPFPENFFDNSPFFKYIETAPGGIKRFRGILSEPSALAGSALVAASFFVSWSFRVRGARRLLALFMTVLAIFLGFVSTSTTFILAGAVILAISASYHSFQFIKRKSSVGWVTNVIGFLTVLTSLWFIPIIVTFLELTISDKVETSSYVDRSAADQYSYELFLETFGLGVGLGANRASSFLAGIISTTGLFGFLLFAGTVAILITVGGRHQSYRPVAWGLIALLVLKVISGPDLSDPSGILWLSLGLLAHAAAHAKSVRSNFKSPISGTVYTASNAPATARRSDAP